MRTRVLLSASAIALTMCFGVASAADDDASVVAAPSAAGKFSILAGIEATPMPASELETVRGQHVHFLDPNGGFHLAGNPANSGIGTGNWYLNGSPDGQLVAPSYHGLCVAAGTASGILIPPISPEGPTAPQCP